MAKFRTCLGLGAEQVSIHRKVCTSDVLMQRSYRWFIFDWGALLRAGRLYWGVKKCAPLKKDGTIKSASTASLLKMMFRKVSKTACSIIPRNIFLPKQSTRSIISLLIYLLGTGHYCTLSCNNRLCLPKKVLDQHMILMIHNLFLELY